MATAHLSDPYVTVLATARKEFEGDEERQEDLDVLHNSVEDWVDAELDPLRFLRRR